MLLKQDCKYFHALSNIFHIIYAGISKIALYEWSQEQHILPILLQNHTVVLQECRFYITLNPNAARNFKILLYSIAQSLF